MRRTWRWVILSHYNFNVQIIANAEKPRDHGSGFTNGSSTVFVCSRQFKKLFGFIPKRGQLLKVEFKAKLLKG